MAIFGSVDTLRQQVPHTAAFKSAFAYLDDMLRAGSEARQRIAGLASGASQKRELAGGAFAIEQVYDARSRADGFFESHRRFIDIQVIVEGNELMEVIDLSRIEAREPYDEDRDLLIYRDAPDASVLRLIAGQAAVFFPEDVHMPSLRVPGAPLLVRKSVVKVPVG